MDNPAPQPADQEKPLPAVTPPSGRFLAQLFLVPGLIVAVVVLFILAIQYMAGDSRNPEHFLSKLDDDNADVRWRGANDLAQVIKRPESVAMRCDAKFALDIAERLRAALEELWEAEKLHAQRTKNLDTQEQERSWHKLAPRRHYVEFLAEVLASFHMAVGANLLSEMALKEDSLDRAGNVLRRTHAVWALANLGNQCKNFTRLKEEERQAIRTRLVQEAEKETTHGQWARTALYYLDTKGKPGPGVVLVDQVLARCARAADQGIRLYVALALSSWEGDQVEPTLLQLARDPGFGPRRRPKEKE